jgi:ATP-dependent protease HslVU (ClpYQ) peptidase subunit
VTVIAGIIAKDGTIWMAGDSAFSNGYSVAVKATQKVFQIGPFLIGCCGSPRVMNVLRYAFTPPKHPRGMDVPRYMNTLFVDAMREALKRGGTLHTMNAVEEFVDSGALVGYRRRIFEIQCDFQVQETADAYVAMGSGEDIALGALAVTAEMPPRKRLLAAMAASERFNAGVRRPFTVLTMEAQ